MTPETIGQIGEFTIKIVDGELLRKENPDFYGYGHHYTNTGIPKKEIWLDGSIDHRELLFSLLRALFEYALYKRGIPNEIITERSKALDENLRAEGPPEDVKVRRLSVFGEMDVWLVNGGQVRKCFYPDFAQGGNGYRYDFIPKTEIWIEAEIPAEERTFVLLHELYESALMKDGIPYDSAHEQATYIEKKLRNAVSEKP